MMDHLKSLVGALLVAIALLPASAAWAGTVTKTFPDLDQHERWFFEMPIGITQKAFRVKAPAAWRPVSRLGDLKQNTNLRGEVNRGWFKYDFVVRGTRYPEMEFKFWEGKLIYAALVSYTGDAKLGRAHYDAALLATELLEAKFGSSQPGKIDRSSYEGTMAAGRPRYQAQCGGQVSMALCRVDLAGRLTPNHPDG